MERGGWDEGYQAQQRDPSDRQQQQDDLPSTLPPRNLVLPLFPAANAPACPPRPCPSPARLPAPCWTRGTRPVPAPAARTATWARTVHPRRSSLPSGEMMVAPP